MLLSISLSTIGLIFVLTGIVVLAGGDGVSIRGRRVVGWSFVVVGFALFGGAFLAALRW